MADDERPGPCEECKRLREQARAATVAGDRSRLSDVRIMQRRHREDVHGQDIPEDEETAPAIGSRPPAFFGSIPDSTLFHPPFGSGRNH